MAAPSGTVWGSVVGGYGRVGIHVALTHTATTTRRVVTLWFWSKYAVSDSSNTLYYNAGTTSASSSKGSVSISTSVSSGTGWSTSNQVKLKTYDHTYSRGTSTWSESCAMKLVGIDRVGGTMTATTSYTVPKLDSYTVSYNANGGTGAPSAHTKYYGKNITLSATKPTRTGYTFQGWATSAGGAVAYQPGATYSANAGITLYAKWTAITYAVYYNGDGGTNIPSTQTKTYGVNLTLSTTKPTKTGYTFLGWATSAGGSVAYQPGQVYTTNAAVTLYARWQIITYSIIYDANGGTGAPVSQTKNYGSTLTLSPVEPTRTNYNFLGWSPNKSATSATYSAGGSYTTNSSVIFYAVWKLAYVKPRITNMSITRCDVDGNLSDSGTYALLNFTYATDLKPRNPLITYMYNGEEQNQMLMIAVVQDPVTGEEIYSTKDTFNNVIVGAVVEGGPFSLETGHTINITLSDGEGGPDNTTIMPVNLPAMKFTMDLLSGGKGIAIGKPANKEGFECDFPAYFNKSVYGQVRGLGKAEPIPENSDLNNYKIPGVYAVSNDAIAKTISNIPIQQAGILIVSSALGQDINVNGAYQYVRQEYKTYCASTQPSFERHLETGTTAGSWIYGAWIRNARILFDSYGVAMIDTPGATTSGWLKTPTLGLIPYTIGTNSSIGSSTWRFKESYFGCIDLVSSGTSWIGGKTKANASIQINTQLSSGSYHPIMWMKTYSSHIVNLGGFINNFGVYGILSSQTANGTNWQTYWDCTNGNLIHNQGLYMANNKLIHGTNTSGTRIEAINLCSSSNNLSIGYGGYANKLGATYIYGNSVYLYSNDGRIYFQTALTLNHQMNLGTTKASDGEHYYINNNGTGRFNALRYVSSKAISSRRFKNNIDYKDVDYWHEALMQIKPCTFFYNNDDKTKHIGLIAEDLYDLIPELVGLDDEEKTENEQMNVKPLPSAIEYANLTVPIIGELQLLNNRLEEQDKRISEQDEIIRSQNERIAKLEELVQQLLDK